MAPIPDPPSQAGALSLDQTAHDGIEGHSYNAAIYQGINMMAWEGWFVLFIISLCFGLMATNRFSPDLVLMGGLTLLLISDIITPTEALAGLANESMVTIA
ncbi:MAG: hypothetical protein AB2531_02895, partial [Candidatus Thiodiazotropha sp.]